MKTPTPLIGALALICASFAHAGPTFTFDSGPDGWVGGGGRAAGTWSSLGGVGNSGYFQTIDTAGGQMVAVAPAMGDQSAALGGVLTFEYNVFALGPHNLYAPNIEFGRTTIVSGSQFTVADLIPDVPAGSSIVGTGWHVASLALEDSLWQGNASLSSILKNVTQISLVTEYDRTQRWPDEVVGLDNFALQPLLHAQVSLPEPTTTALFAGGLLMVLLHRKRRAEPLRFVRARRIAA